MISKNFKLYEGLDGFFHTAIGIAKRAFISSKKLRDKALASHEFSNSFDSLNDDEFSKLLITSMHDIRRQKTDDERYVGVIAQAVTRVFEISPHIEQLMGVHALIDAKIIQMHTGEGKTLTAAMGAVYKGWKSGNCHVATSNDYLAQRDAQNMQSLFTLCNLDVGFVISSIEPSSRKEIYAKKIVYSTSKELLADYLRDQESNVFEKYSTQKLFDKVYKDGDERVMRGLDSIIVDEADSVLADEATVPLIIASQNEQPYFHEALVTIYEISKKLINNQHYLVDAKHKEILLKKEGRDEYEKYIDSIPKVWQSRNRREYLLKQILIAEYFYEKNKNYLIKDDEIVIIDEKTGRSMQGRSWGGALHQAIEIKEGVKLTQMSKTHKKMSFQFFFRLYNDLSGMSGTLDNIHNELWNIYEKLTIHIPTHKPKQVTFFDEVVCKDKDEKWFYVHQEAIKNAKLGKAVLVGTTTIGESELLYEMIQKEYKNVILLNAIYEDEEADIISKAGESSKITIATNMAGRGTDILLSKDVVKSGGLHVISTQRNESKRVDMQLYGRAGRQGQVGSVISIVSIEDYLFEKYSPRTFKKLVYKLQTSPNGRKVISIYTDILQYISERSISNIRKESFKNDIKTIKKMSFADV